MIYFLNQFIAHFIQMEFVRIAERQNAERALRHKKYRRKDWMIAGTVELDYNELYGTISICLL